MAISVSNANILFKDKSGNVGKVNTLTDNDIAKLSNGLQTIENHTTSLSTLTSSINRVNDKFADYSTTSEINTALGNYATTANVDTKITTQCVTLTDKQLVQGEKNMENIRFYKSNIDTLAPPTFSTIWAPTLFVDKNYRRLVCMSIGQYTTGALTFNMGTCQYITDKNTYSNLGGISIKGFKDGTSSFEITATKTYAKTPDLTANDTQLATTNWVNNKVSSQLPTGTILAWSVANKTPSGFLCCNGAAISRTTYATLFSIIGTTWGKGDNSTTFNIPDLRYRFLEGATVGTYISAGLPNITGYANASAEKTFTSASGCFSNTSAGGATEGHGYNVCAINFKASGSNSIYGSSSTVQPPAAGVDFIIKY